MRERKKTGDGGAAAGVGSKAGGGGGVVVTSRRDSKPGGVAGVVSQAGAENEEKLREGLNVAWLGGEKLSSGAGAGGASATTSIQVRSSFSRLCVHQRALPPPRLSDSVIS